VGSGRKPLSVKAETSVGLGEVPAAVLKYKPQQSSGGNPFCFIRQHTMRGKRHSVDRGKERVK
jgi:hypothetical protein